MKRSQRFNSNARVLYTSICTFSRQTTGGTAVSFTTLVLSTCIVNTFVLFLFSGVGRGCLWSNFIYSTNNTSVKSAVTIFDDLGYWPVLGVSLLCVGMNLPGWAITSVSVLFIYLWFGLEELRNELKLKKKKKSLCLNICNLTACLCVFEARVQAVRLGCDWYHQQHDCNRPVTRVSMATMAPVCMWVCVLECIWKTMWHADANGTCRSNLQSGVSKQQNQTAAI